MARSMPGALRAHAPSPGPRLVAALALLAAGATAQVTFLDVAVTSGIDNTSFGRGTAIVDFDGDGLLDIANANAGQPNVFYRQHADHVFEEANDLWNVPIDSWSSWAVVATDLDGDGDDDVFFASGGFAYQNPNQLLRNDIATSGGFTDVSPVAGDVVAVSRSFGATGLDYDLDGDIDLYVPGNGDTSHLFRNDGGLVFTDVGQQAGIDVPEDLLHHASSGDYDNDGWPDMGVGHIGGPNHLWHNLGDGTFEDVAVAAGVDAPEHNFGLVFEDFDNDGWLDIWLPNYRYVGYPVGTRVFLNNHDGTFTNVTAGSGLGAQTDMGHNSADVDGDGHPDIFSGTGRAGVAFDDVLMLVEPDGQGGIAATDVSSSSGILASGPTRCHGIAFFDYEQDGDLDIYCNNGGPEWLPETLQEDFLWQNQGSANRHLSLALDGVLSNTSAVGARARVVLDDGREIHRHLTAGKGFGNTDSPILHFGLGEATGIEELFVRWPSGVTQRVLEPQLDARIDMVETGLRVVDGPVPALASVIELAGPGQHVVELLLGLQSASIPLPAFGGVLEVFPLIADPIAIGLNSDGRNDLPVPVLGDPTLEGIELHVQAWVHPPGQGGGSLTNADVLVLE